MRDDFNGGAGDRDRGVRAQLSPFVSDEMDEYERELDENAEGSAEREAAPTQVRARILWPALGFPAVIAPRARPADVADATRCLCVLLLSNQKTLSKADAAR